MRTALALLIAAVAHFGNASEARADGGTIRLHETRGDLQVAIFTSPAPLRAGEADLSVLVQDKANSMTGRDAKITIVARPRDLPGRSPPILASREAATNKLLQAAKFQLSQPGWWSVEVEVQPPGQSAQRFAFDVEVAPALPRWMTFWPWFTWPAVVIALFGWRRHLLRKKHVSREKLVHPAASAAR